MTTWMGFGAKKKTDKKSFASRISARSGPRPRPLSHDSIQFTGIQFKFQILVNISTCLQPPFPAFSDTCHPEKSQSLSLALSQLHAPKGCWQSVNDAVQAKVLATTAPNSTLFLHLRTALSNPTYNVCPPLVVVPSHSSPWHPSRQSVA